MAQDKQQNNNVPGWAASFTEAEYERFLSLIEDYFKSRSIPYSLQGDVIKVPTEFFGGIVDEGILKLFRVAGFCRDRHRDLWKITIDNYFDDVQQVAEFERDLKENADNFNFFLPYLTARMWILEDHVMPHKFELYQNLFDNAYAEIIFDFPLYKRPVYESEIINWGKTKDDIIMIAIYQFLAKQETALPSFNVLSGLTLN